MREGGRLWCRRGPMVSAPVVQLPPGIARRRCLAADVVRCGIELLKVPVWTAGVHLHVPTTQGVRNRCPPAVAEAARGVVGTATPLPLRGSEGDDRYCHPAPPLTCPHSSPCPLGGPGWRRPHLPPTSFPIIFSHNSLNQACARSGWGVSSPREGDWHGIPHLQQLPALLERHGLERMLSCPHRDGGHKGWRSRACKPCGRRVKVKASLPGSSKRCNSGGRGMPGGDCRGWHIRQLAEVVVRWLLVGTRAGG